MQRTVQSERSGGLAEDLAHRRTEVWEYGRLKRLEPRAWEVVKIPVGSGTRYLFEATERSLGTSCSYTSVCERGRASELVSFRIC